MDDLIIEKTASSPEIHFSQGHNGLLIKGKSYMENSAQFYGPVFDWLERHLCEDGLKNIEINMEIIYFNSSSFKMFLNLFELLENAITRNQCDICVNWRYDPVNRMAMEYGEELQEEVKLVKFNLVPHTPA
ncbi:MAG: DUF1987 domain-containing protein [Magnetococcus sp. YQC-5]